jgi:hypothetical protein
MWRWKEETKVRSWGCVVNEGTEVCACDWQRREMMVMTALVMTAKKEKSGRTRSMKGS